MEREAPSLQRDTVTRTSSSFRATAAQVGFSPPPFPIRLKLLRGPSHWSLFLQPEGASSAGAIVAWLEPWSPLRIEFGSRGVLRADFDPLPVAWSQRYEALELEMLSLHPDGSALATVTGARAALAAYARLVSPRNEPLDVRRVGDRPRDLPLLTKAQDQALRAAVDAGYYRIPRPLNLHDLAIGLGITSASLSERLRRAEGRVIHRYVKNGGTSPWDARSIFDEQPLVGHDAVVLRQGAT